MLCKMGAWSSFIKKETIIVAHYFTFNLIYFVSNVQNRANLRKFFSTCELEHDLLKYFCSGVYLAQVTFP